MASVAPEDDEYEVEELDVDPVMGMMPMSFGKQEKKRDLTASFAKTKRVVKENRGRSDLQQEKLPQPEVMANPAQDQDDEDDGDEGDEDDSDDDSDDMIGPMPAEAEEQDEDDQFPISHEIVLKDHAKVLRPAVFEWN